MAHIRHAEARLKAAVVDRLLHAGVLDASSVLVSELTVANWRHRTDIVVANGRLWGFELKSDRDSLDRLPSQLRAFSTLFEKLIVVVAEKFETKATPLIREVDGAGLWVARKSGDIVERIRPKATTMGAEAAISLMTASELRRLLSASGIKGLHSAPRVELVRQSMKLPSRVLADAARDAIKARFQEVHARFLEARGRGNTLEALPLLTRSPARAKAAVTSSPAQRWASDLPDIPLDHPNILLAPSGPVIARAAR